MMKYEILALMVILCIAMSTLCYVLTVRLRNEVNKSIKELSECHESTRAETLQLAGASIKLTDAGLATHNHVVELVRRVEYLAAGEELQQNDIQDLTKLIDTGLDSARIRHDALEVRVVELAGELDVVRTKLASGGA